MRFQRFEIPGLAHYSYLLISGGCAAAMDPERNPEPYLEYAAAHDLRLTHVFETHIHADYASGARELAERSGAELCLSAYDTGEDFEVAFPHRELKEGDEVRIGHMRAVALHTPGHTPEHLSFLIYEERGHGEPVMMLSGDFVFVGSLGRPDLLGEAAKHRLAEKLWESVTEKLRPLPDGLEIQPAHGAGSMCGASIGDRPQSTLGYERRCNQFLVASDRQQFIEQILSTVPPFPDYYRRMKRVNSEGPARLGSLAALTAYSPAEFRKALDQTGTVVIDLRRPEAFGGGHVPGSFSIGAGPSLPVWASWVVPYDTPILLVGDDGADYRAARRALVRVGLDDVRGFLKGGIRSWIEAGCEQAHLLQVDVSELYGRPSGACVLDVRSAGEWRSGHVQGARHIFAGDLGKRLEELPRGETVHVICGSGYRSSVAASVLRRAGFKDVVNVVGGMNAWKSRELPLE